jgi:GNAT superfamily N-acetyltransferase
MEATYEIRKATASPADIDMMTAHRVAMFADMGSGDDASRAEMSGRFAAWVEPRLHDASFHAWFLESGGVPVAGAACWIRERHPGIHAGPRDDVAYVLNVYTAPAHRSRGLARRLMEEIIAWARADGFDTVELHASDQGRPLYDSMGFESRPSTMRLKLV